MCCKKLKQIIFLLTSSYGLTIIVVDSIRDHWWAINKEIELETHFLKYDAFLYTLLKGTICACLEKPWKTLDLNYQLISKFVGGSLHKLEPHQTK